jgi:hypothetical protein
MSSWRTVSKGLVDLNSRRNGKCEPTDYTAHAGPILIRVATLS